MANPQPTHTETAQDAEMRAAIEAGLQSLDAGQSVPYEDVRKWLLSWGSDKELPAPKCR
jgi:predicted transcriptional regulator